jgi:5-methylcytosine-specific restriction endonuclease McrA
MKRSRIKQHGKAYQHYQDMKDDREAWKLSQKPQCWACQELFRHDRLDVHEILRRSRTLRPFGRWNLTLLCRKCHDGHDVAASNRESMTRMLARKKYFDPMHYNLLAWLCARDQRALQFITEEEVEHALRELGLQ